MRTTMIAVVAFVVAGCDCGSSHTLDSSTIDGSTVDALDAGLPDVERERTCSEIDAGPEEVCIEEGWFNFAQWSPLNHADLASPHVLRPVYLDSFLIDRTEVSNEDFQRWLSRSSAEPPNCDAATEFFACAGCEGPREFEMHVPWNPDGSIVSGFERHPVMCVSKATAQQYCADHGGRLPSVYEWAKAAAPPYPDSWSFPWGYDEDISRISQRQIPLPAPELPLTEPVGSFAAGASFHGVLDLSASVSEFVDGCADSLRLDPAPSVRPIIRSCASDLVAGSNWLSYSTDAPAAWIATLTTGVFEVRDGHLQLLGDEPHMLRDADVMGGMPVIDGAARSWRVGFRCAYTPSPP